MAGPVSDTKLNILKFIVEWLEKNRSSPTLEEIAVVVGLASRSSVQYHIDNLISEGHLSRPPRRHRMITPTQQGVDAINKMKETD